MQAAAARAARAPSRREGAFALLGLPHFAPPVFRAAFALGSFTVHKVPAGGGLVNTGTARYALA